MLAPIVLFVYNRPSHTKKVLDALCINAEAKDCILYIYCDGSKPKASLTEKKNIDETRSLVKNENRFKEIFIFEQEKNLGLSRSIIKGVTEVINQHGSIIVLEDDILPSKGFLKYMNDALDIYDTTNEVGCIHAWNYNLETTNHNESTFFLKGADCWGWATWKKAWDLFEENGSKLLQTISSKKLENEFDRRGTHNFSKMLEEQISGKIDSWAVRWHASLFLANKFCLHPSRAIVKNIGHDNSGVHCVELDLDQDPVEYIEVKKIQLKESEWFFKAYKKYSKQYTVTKGNRWQKIKKTLKPFFPSKAYAMLSRLTKNSTEQNVWRGNYTSWHEANKISTGYDSETILEKCKNALLKVKNGEAVYERDSVLFNEVQLSHGLLNYLKQTATENNNKLCVLDFGGSLGSSYYQNKNYLNDLTELNWCIVEQPNFVQCGKDFFEDENLKFYLTIEDCLKAHKPDIILLSSVIQYIEKPFELIQQILKLKVKYLIFDRLALSNENKDILTIQSVSDNYYESKLCHWFFSEDHFVSLFKKNYELIESAPSYADIPLVLNKKIKCHFNLLIFQAK
ncbi:MAG: methyltransferase, TIGR04325 family [Bacteroidia bacterium]